MTIYYAAIEAFDPEGQANMPDGATYGGEARFLVLQGESLADALATAANSLAVNGLRLDRVLHAGSVQDFDDEMLPFEIDIDAMAEAAAQSGEICVSEAHPFEPDETDGKGSGAFACCIDAFDGEWADEDEGEYAGHYQLVVIKAASAVEALQELVETFDAEEIQLLSIEGLVDAEAFPFDGYEFTFDEEDPVGDVLEQGGIIVSNAYAYPPEAPQRLNS